MTDRATVRRATAGDGRRIAEVHVESWRAAYQGIVPAAILDGLSVERRAAFWDEVIATPGEAGPWVAEVAGVVVGFADGGPARGRRHPPVAGRRRAEPAVRSAYRGPRPLVAPG